MTAPGRVTRWARRFDELFDERGSLGAVLAMRAIFGLIVVVHFSAVVSEPQAPIERFHVPWWSWVPEPSPVLYYAISWLGIVAGIAMAIGLWSRLSTAVALVTLLALMVQDIGSFHHNRAFLSLMLFGLVLIPSGGAFWPVKAVTLRGRNATLVDGPLWPVYLMRVLHSSIYLASGGTKWFDADWRSGRTLWARVSYYQSYIPAEWMRSTLLSRGFWSLAAPVVLATELVIGFGLWPRRTRVVAMVLAVVFHVSIALTASVQTFSLSGITALLLWFAVPTGARRVQRMPKWLSHAPSRPSQL
ncbi:MAG: HTTM domain-containing protein [Acidimicrobiia bacterium]